MVTYWDFNSRPSARGDTRRLLISSSRNYFNSRPSARGDRRHPTHRRPEYHFNSRPSARGDERRRSGRATASHFNSRPSARGDITADIDPDNNEVFQFTPLREGRLSKRRKRQHVICISIHAPPRGATAAVVRGRESRHYFNSRPSARGDAFEQMANAIPYIISIHAPPRGATTRLQTYIREGHISIHAPPRGATSQIPQTQDVL